MTFSSHTILQITGGLGGFGLELADWLVLRGARKLVLTSRHGPKTGYQSLRLRIWRSYGVTVVISVADITSRNGVADLLSGANKLGPVDAIFNLAVVITDPEGSSLLILKPTTGHNTEPI
jgi:fatty acid synthase